MNHPLALKIRQMHAALGCIRSTDLNQIRVNSIRNELYEYHEIDFSGGTNEVELANIVTLLIANIGSLRDHLKNWCGVNGVIFEGDILINSNPSCAIIHDLWNTDKHVELNRPPRSGHHVRLVNVSKSMQVSTGAEAGSFSSFSWNPVTGEMVANSSGGGSVSIVISGQVLDEAGNTLGDFSKLAEEAVEGWEQCLRQAGAMS